MNVFEIAIGKFVSPFGILGRVADRLFLIDYMRRFLQARHALIKTVAETEQWRRYLTV